MIHNILVPLDGSGFSEQAIPVALGVSDRTGATMELVTAYDLYDDAAAASLAGVAVRSYQLPVDVRTEERRAKRSAYLDTLSRRLRSETGRPIRSELIEGRTTEALAERARHSADLVIMSTHARGGLSRLWLGSVADQLLREVSVPVLLVKPNESEAAIDSTRTPCFRRVLIPLDGSALAEAVLGPLVELLGAELEQTTCTIVQVQSPAPTAPAVSLHVAAFSPTPKAPDRETTAAPYPAEVTGRLREAGLQVQVVTVVHERTAQAILETARNIGADLIAIATHGRGGIKRLLIGSVADAVVRGAETSVLVYRPRDLLAA